MQPLANPDLKDYHNFIIINNFDGTPLRFYENHLVIQTKNNYRAVLANKSNIVFIPNDEIGIIRKIYANEALIEFKNKVICKNEDLKNLKLAYSISAHKSQD